MIAHLSGNIIDIEGNQAILETNGVGYLVHLTRKTANSISIHSNISFHIYSHIREEEISLYGFLNKEEKNFFLMLIKIKGIGPKIGLEMIDAKTQLIKKAILTNDTFFLSKIPGIGKKTAERIILELKNKIEPDFINNDEFEESNNNAANNSEVIEALTALGYDKNHIHRTLIKAPKELHNSEDLIEYFIKNS